MSLAATSCGSSGEAGGDELLVVASFYPLAEAAERVAGDMAVVENLTPPGVEPHDLELTSDQLEALVTADLVVYIGGGFQPAVEDGVDQAEGATLDLLDHVGALRPPEEEGEEELTADPHVWLDPARFAAIVDAIAQALAELEPARAQTLRANADAYGSELTMLDREFSEGLATCRSRTVVVNHSAFGYLADTYDLEELAISGISPDAEVDPARLAEVRDLVEARGITTIFTEELASPEVAETLAEEAGVSTAVLSPLEGLTEDELDAGEDYRSVMRRNLGTLRTALGCT